MVKKKFKSKWDIKYVRAFQITNMWALPINITPLSYEFFEEKKIGQAAHKIGKKNQPAKYKTQQ
jgi:hypothetical protein